MSKNKKPIKICFTTVSLAGGGAERVAATLSVFLEKQGYEVHHVVFAGKIVYPFAGKLLHLETLKDKKNSFFSRFKRFLALKKHFDSEQFDVIIDYRVKKFYVQEWIIHTFIYKKFIQTIHSNHLESYFPKNKLFAKLLYKKAIQLVTVSSEINKNTQLQYDFSNLLSIYNPIDFQIIDSQKREVNALQFSYIIGVGRMEDNVKQFDHLIECYANSILPKKNIKLVILGEGKFRQKYEELAKTLHQEENIVFLGSVVNPFKYFAKALFTVMTSKYEGFPMVLLESLACETPVVSYDLHSGPSEVIIPNKNGILVENQNKTEMTKAINELFSNNELYHQCKKNAKQSVDPFSIQNIGKQWIALIEKQIKIYNIIPNRCLI